MYLTSNKKNANLLILTVNFSADCKSHRAKRIINLIVINLGLSMIISATYMIIRFAASEILLIVLLQVLQ